MGDVSSSSHLPPTKSSMDISYVYCSSKFVILLLYCHCQTLTLRIKNGRVRKVLQVPYVVTKYRRFVRHKSNIDLVNVVQSNQVHHSPSIKIQPSFNKHTQTQCFIKTFITRDRHQSLMIFFGVLFFFFFFMIY